MAKCDSAWFSVVQRGSAWLSVRGSEHTGLSQSTYIRNAGTKLQASRKKGLKIERTKMSTDGGYKPAIQRPYHISKRRSKLYQPWPLFDRASPHST